MTWKAGNLDTVLSYSTAGYRLWDIAFKDSLTGWFASNFGCYKTTDGGNNWFLVTQGNNGGGRIMGLYFDSNTDGLFLSSYGGVGPYWHFQDAISWDEGATWVPFGSVNAAGGGFAFCNIDTGLVSTSTDFNGNYWWRTMDGGHSWFPLSIDSDSWQPLGIHGTSTFFAITYWGNVIRSDNAGTDWRVVYSGFPSFDSTYLVTNAYLGSRTIRGTLDSLYTMQDDGCYFSSDQGVSWKYLCGIPDSDYLVQRLERFYVRNQYIYVLGWYLNNPAVLSYLNMDSLNIFSSSMQHASVSGTGNERSVTFQSQIEASAAVDTVHFSLRYDTSLLLDGISVPANWHILDSSRNGNILTVTIFDTSSTVDTPSITLNFRHFVTPSQSDGMVWLDSARLFGKWMNCDIYAQSATASDSVQLDFPNCADTILLDAMEGKPLFSIQSIVPNPAQNSITVQVAAVGDLHAIGYEIDNILGKTSASGIYNTDVRSTSLRLDVSSLPAGTYYLRMSENGYVQTRKIEIER